MRFLSGCTMTTLRKRVEAAEKLYQAARSLDLTQISYAADAYHALEVK